MNCRALLSFTFFLVSALFANAGGSIHRDGLQELFKTNPVVAKLIQKSFALEEVGEAIRLGKFMGDLGGARIGPYEFPAKTKPDGTKVTLILHTEVTVTNAKGKVVELDNLTPEMSGLKISEKLQSFEIKAEAEETPKAKSIGDHVRELGDEALTWTKAEFEDDDEPGFGEIRRGYLKNELRRVILEVNMGDHYVVNVDVFSNEAKKPVFVLVTEKSWNFPTPKRVEEEVKERRLYFENEKLTKILEKSYVVREESQRVAMRDAAVNKKVAVSSVAGSKWYGLSQALFNELSKEKLRQHAEAFADFE